MIGIAAGETENPQKTIPKAINEILIRILIFYIGTMLVLMTLAPWDMVGMKGSPFVEIFNDIGIPAAANILNFVVLIAALSVFNSVLYSNSRMLYGLAKNGNAPNIFASITVRGIPMVGIVFSSVVALAIVLLTYAYPKSGEVFMQLLGLVVGGLIISWGIIIITHIKFRKHYIKAGTDKQLQFRSFLYPWLDYLCLLFLLGIVCVMYTMDSMRMSVYAMPIWILFMYGMFKLKKKNR